MLFMAERFRYVHIPEHSSITSSLSQSSQDLKLEIENTKEAKNLHDEKYLHVQRAEQLLDTISADIKTLVRMLPLKGKAAARPTQKTKAKQVRLKQYISEDEKAMVERSHKALRNLQANLAELKSELGRVR